MLTGAQRRYLRGAAHELRPSVQVGKEGVSDTVVDAVDAALTAHELIKVQIAATREARDAVVATLERRVPCECAGTIGRVAILFRRHPDPERRRLVLP